MSRRPVPHRSFSARSTTVVTTTSPSAGTGHISPRDLADEAIELVRHWLTEGSKQPVDSSARQLAGVLKDPQGLDFTVGFVDGVIRPEDLQVAARNLRALAPKVPSFLPWYMRSAVALGGAMAPVLPGVVIPVARRVLREMVGHLIVDATDAKLGPAIEKIQQKDVRLNINLLGEAILGEKEAGRRLAGISRLLRRPDVDYVSVKVSSSVAPHNHWDFDAAVGNIVDQLTPLYRQARDSSPRKFINLDMEEYKDLDLTMAVFKRLMALPEFKDVEAGIVLQAYLPDALPAMIELQEFAAERVASGGAPVKVRLVKGANLPMEIMEADIHGWPAATWHSKQATDTSYKAVIDYALRPEHIANVHLGIAGHNLFDIALAHLLAKARGISEGIDFEMLLGMATGQAAAVKADVGSLLLYTPVVHPGEFDVAISYLIRRLEEGASQENFMSAVFELHENEALFERETDRFRASLEDLSDTVPTPNRIQDRSKYDAEAAASEVAEYASGERKFSNTPDTDPDLVGNRAWANEILTRVPQSTLGRDTIESHLLTTTGEVDAVITATHAAAESWGQLSGAERAAVLHHAGERLAAYRGELLEVMASECGKTLDQGDPEVSEAIDFAHFYAESARALDTVDGATFVPSRLTVVTPPWNFPVAIPAGSTLSALAAGSGVVIKPAKQAARSGAIMVQAIWEALDAAGIGRELLSYVQLSERDLGTRLVSHPSVDRLILTGGYETAELFRSFREDLPLLAETSGKNALIVTASADLDLAARDVAASAFGHAGQKCSAASLVIMVGAVAKSPRFHSQLVDAVSSLQVGYPDDAGTQMGPVIEPAQGKLLRGLTTLGTGERWVLEPRQLDDSGQLWSPGVRTGVQRGSEYHLTEYFGPILGVMTAETLEEAVEMVNDIDYGLTTGLHSLDPDELDYWLDNVKAGNLYVNRGITGAIVRRQPFGGWKKSAVGAGTKAGGPNYLVGMGSWVDAPVSAEAEAAAESHAAVSHATVRTATGTDTSATSNAEVAGGSDILGVVAAEAGPAAGNAIDPADFAWLQTARATDYHQVVKEFGAVKDVSMLQAERNIFRYRPVPVTVRYEEETSGHGMAELLRVVSAGLRAHKATSSAGASGRIGTTERPGAGISVSVTTELPARVLAALRSEGVEVAVEDARMWKAHVERLARQTGPDSGARVRYIGASSQATYAAAQGKPDVAIYDHPVVAAGRVELLPFVREQAISITAHRFGTPDHLSDTII
ncbi:MULTISPECIES: proline dehydrogenase family protein [Micrococcaceae]|uniref:proline dehydrogenase family protein n=1 Tax=Arthrobacter rhombi TaxID=71253 RepID=UPI000B35965D|nr:1-pyrroline-5-carboxylate dehydrogenase [Glutamicibacter sp. BW78]